MVYFSRKVIYCKIWTNLFWCFFRYLWLVILFDRPFCFFTFTPLNKYQYQMNPWIWSQIILIDLLVYYGTKDGRLKITYCFMVLLNMKWIISIFRISIYNFSAIIFKTTILLLLKYFVVYFCCLYRGNWNVNWYDWLHSKLILHGSDDIGCLLLEFNEINKMIAC